MRCLLSSDFGALPQFDLKPEEAFPVNSRHIEQLLFIRRLPHRSAAAGKSYILLFLFLFGAH